MLKNQLGIAGALSGTKSPGLLASQSRRWYWLCMIQLSLSTLLIFLANAWSAPIERFDLPVENGESLKVVVAKHNASSPKQKLPVLILLGGFKTSDKVVQMVETNEPLMVVSFEYPYQEKQLESFKEKVKEIPVVKKAIFSTLEGIIFLAEKLSVRPDVDPTRITVAGGSFGSPFAIVAAQKSAHISGLVLIHGFAEIAKPMQVQLERAWEKDLRGFASPVAFVTSKIAKAYIHFPDPEQSLTLLREDQKVLMVALENDLWIPSSVTESMWTAMRASKAKVFRENRTGDHEIQMGDASIRSLTTLIINWMKQNKLM